MGLLWYQHMQVQPNYYTGGSQVVYSYIAVDSKLATLNDVNKLSQQATVDPSVTHDSTGLLIASVTFLLLALTAAMLLQRGVSQFRWRRALFLSFPLLSALAGVLQVGAVAHWAASDVKEATCVFFAGPGALEPNQSSTCGYGPSFNACVAAVPFAILQAVCFAVWLQGDAAALLCGSSTTPQRNNMAASSMPVGGAAAHTPPVHEHSALLRAAGKA